MANIGLPYWFQVQLGSDEGFGAPPFGASAVAGRKSSASHPRPTLPAQGFMGA